MTRRRCSVQIDRLVVDGLDVDPDRAASIRRLAVDELEQMLRAGSGVARSRSIGTAVAPPLVLADGPVSERTIAEGVARRIVAALREAHRAV